MSKIKNLRTKAETYVLSKEWAYQKVTQLSAYIISILDAHERGYYENYITKKLEERNLSGVVHLSVETVARNTLLDLTANKRNRPHPSLPLEMMLNITMRATEIIVTELSNVIGVQPLSGPVGNISMLCYKEASGTSNVPLAQRPGKSPVGVSRSTLTLEVITETVSASTRKLEASWNFETMQDIKFYKSTKSLDLQSEIEKAVAYEIAYEIVNEILESISKEAITVESGFDLNFSDMLGDGSLVNLSKIGIEINGQANDIARTTRRGAGNFIVCSPMVIAALQSAPKSVFAPPPAPTALDKPNGRYSGEILRFAGTLNGSIKVYCSLWGMGDITVENGIANSQARILVGYKGGMGEADTGYVYSPYILVAPGAAELNPITYQTTRTLHTRAAGTYLDSNYFRVINFKSSGL